jgi:hypothetical protein
MGEMRNAYNILVENPVGKRPLGRYRCRWEEKGLDRDKWRDFVKTVMNRDFHNR